MTTDMVILNSDGRFYAGMTAKDAQQRDVYKCTLRRDFKNLDKDKNGVLSVQEIMDERNRERNVAIFSTLAWLALGVADFILEKDRASRNFWLAIDGLITGISAHNLYTINKKTKAYNAMIEDAEYKKLDKKA